MSKGFRSLIWTIVIGAVVFLMVWGYISSDTDSQITVNSYSSDTSSFAPLSTPPTPEVVDKLHENMSVYQIIDCLFSAKNDSDLILISGYITLDNAPALCEKFYYEDDEKSNRLKVWINGYKKHPLAKYIVTLPKVHGSVKNQFYMDLVSKLQGRYDEQATQIAEYFFYLHNSAGVKIKEVVSPEEMLELIPPKLLYEVMSRFENLSTQFSKRNYLPHEDYSRRRKPNRPGANFPLTLMQSIVNFEGYSDQEKLVSLRIILSKAVKESPKWNSREKTQEFERNANLFLESLDFDRSMAVCPLDIFVNDLLGNHRKFERPHYNDRKVILEGFHIKHKWAKYRVG